MTRLLDSPLPVARRQRLAVVAGHLAAWALATRSLIPTYTGDPGAALRLLQEAQDRALGDVSPSQLAWVAAPEARAQAGLGNATASLAALGRADRAIERAEPAGGGFANDYFDRPRLVGSEVPATCSSASPRPPRRPWPTCLPCATRPT